MKILPAAINYKGYSIPTGKTSIDKKVRGEIIRTFYEKWKIENPTGKIRNRYLGVDIYVNADSVKESIWHASNSYKSTMMIFHLTMALELSVCTAEEVPKNNGRQRNYRKMLIMEVIIPEMLQYARKGKLIVGVRKKNKKKFQYCLTAI